MPWSWMPEPEFLVAANWEMVRRGDMDPSRMRLPKPVLKGADFNVTQDSSRPTRTRKETCKERRLAACP